LDLLVSIDIFFKNIRQYIYYLLDFEHALYSWDDEDKYLVCPEIVRFEIIYSFWTFLFL